MSAPTAASLEGIDRSVLTRRRGTYADLAGLAPALYRAEVGHTRRTPIEHSFSYDVHTFLVDLDHLPRLPWWLRPFASFRAADHVGDPERSIKDNVVAFLAENGVDLTGGHVLMLANARALGYVFNPLSLHWCFDAAGEQVAVVAEVHNTYGQRHCYLLFPDESGRVEQDKEFYVSPFFTVDGRYLMRISDPTDRLHVTMALRQDGATPFTATLRGDRVPLTARSLLRAVVRRPAMPALVSLWIRLHGIRLWLRKLPVVPRPEHAPPHTPPHPETTTAPPLEQENHR